jgi:hypothetical protein
VYDASVWWSRCADLTAAQQLVGNPERPGGHPQPVGARWLRWCAKVREAEPDLMPDGRDHALDEQVCRFLFQEADAGFQVQEVRGGRFVVLTEPS